jgi:ribosomal protein S18 acetylase RimI-like enzyme
MTGNVAMRRARDDDKEYAWRLYLETIKPYAMEFLEWDDAEQEARFQAYWNPEQTEIILLGGFPVGWMQAEEDNGEVVLQQLYIEPRHQGRGIGSQVLRLLIDRVSDRPIRLGVLKGNPARRLYERFGFAVVGETAIKFIMRREQDS